MNQLHLRSTLLTLRQRQPLCGAGPLASQKPGTPKEASERSLERVGFSRKPSEVQGFFIYRTSSFAHLASNTNCFFLIQVCFTDKPLALHCYWRAGHMCSSLALLCARGLSQNPFYITGQFAGFTYVLLPKACKIIRETQKRWQCRRLRR